MNNIYIFVILLILLSCNEETNKPNENVNSNTGNISGKVTDDSLGFQIVGASIETEPKTGLYSTDNEGKYFISNIDTGIYIISASKSGYNSNSINVIVKQNRITNADIILTKNIINHDISKGSISGKVTEESSGLEVIGATIETEPEFGRYFTDNEGKYKISDIDTGIYKITASKSGYYSSSFNISVKSNNTTNADFILTKNTYVDKTAYVEVELECNKKWCIQVSLDNTSYPIRCTSGIETYKTKEGYKKLIVEEWNILYYSCDKEYGKMWTFEFNLKRGETRKIKVECCD